MVGGTYGGCYVGIYQFLRQWQFFLSGWPMDPKQLLCHKKVLCASSSLSAKMLLFEKGLNFRPARLKKERADTIDDRRRVFVFFNFFLHIGHSSLLDYYRYGPTHLMMWLIPLSENHLLKGRDFLTIQGSSSGLTPFYALSQKRSSCLKVISDDSVPKQTFFSLVQNYQY